MKQATSVMSMGLSILAFFFVKDRSEANDPKVKKENNVK